MSVTVSTCEQICASPTNTSKSKMLHSFPKSTRFPQRKQIMCDKFYDSKPVQITRSTTFGFGNKYDFTKDLPASPPPNSYTLSDFFSKSAKKGFGFGEGRDQMQITGPLMESIRNKNPGPGSYEIGQCLSKQSFKISGKSELIDKEKLKIPGPGAYPVTFCINKKGEYFLAKFKNSCARNFSKLQDRCKTTESKAPGPGAYDVSKANLSPIGKYLLSRMKNSFARKFGSSTRPDLSASFNKFTPGPGNYILPSEFGHYVAKNAVANSNNKQNVANSNNKQNVANS